MNRRLPLALGLLGLVAAAGVSTRSRRASLDAESVPYDVVDTVGDVELRRYPSTLTVETVAPSTRAAFGRLFRYISGANNGSESISMTAPVATDDSDGDVRMAFYLPAEFDYDTAPRPTDPTVELVEQPARTLTVTSFSWWATDGRVARKERALLDALAAADLDIAGEPFLMQYDAPWTPPFLRTNEVAVEVRRRKSA